jgi:ATPase subunit of ABC transporter with duplicated ATPase domains
MSIIISDLSYRYPNQHYLFEHLNFSVNKQSKVSIVGDNGAGKSTLLKLMAGCLQPAGGSIRTSSKPCYLPQLTGSCNKSVAEILGVKEKLAALDAILNGSTSPSDYDTLADDWMIESTCRAALAHWRLPHIKPDTPMDSLSGGEKTRVFLAGLLIRTPGILLLDEPSNHLDETNRNLLYQYIRQSTATIVVVSHDITLLNQLQTTCELSGHGLRPYGGNYSFYKEQKEIEDNALSEDIRTGEKELRLAGKKALEIRQQQEKRTKQGAKNNTQIPRIVRNALSDSAENTAARLGEKQAEIIRSRQMKLAGLKQQQGVLKSLKIDFDNASIPSGKLLVEARQINLAYPGGDYLWENPLDFRLFSNDRIHISGDNGAGKTSLVKLLTGSLAPSCGEIKRADFNWIYLDQDYSEADTACTVEQLTEKYNLQNLEEHERKLRLNRFLFTAGTWNKCCKDLSGGEKMRLCLCCLMISNQTPGLIILDEPANNLDIASLQILTQTIRHYKGSLLVISHDKHFVSEIGITGNLRL